MNVEGRDGRHLQDLWAKDGARAYLGTMLPGFPNLFMLYGPNTNPFSLGVVNFEEMITRFALEAISELIVVLKIGNEPVGIQVDRWTAMSAAAVTGISPCVDIGQPHRSREVLERAKV